MVQPGVKLLKNVYDKSKSYVKRRSYWKINCWFLYIRKKKKK